MGLSNYPPGVTGREFEIAGADREESEQVECPECGNDAIEDVSYFGEQRWWTCSACHAHITQFADKRDWE